MTLKTLNIVVAGQDLGRCSVISLRHGLPSMQSAHMMYSDLKKNDCSTTAVDHCNSVSPISHAIGNRGNGHFLWDNRGTIVLLWTGSFNSIRLWTPALLGAMQLSTALSWGKELRFMWLHAVATPMTWACLFCMYTDINHCQRPGLAEYYHNFTLCILPQLHIMHTTTTLHNACTQTWKYRPAPEAGIALQVIHQDQLFDCLSLDPIVWCVSSCLFRVSSLTPQTLQVAGPDTCLPCLSWVGTRDQVVHLLIFKSNSLLYICIYSCLFVCSLLMPQQMHSLAV